MKVALQLLAYIVANSVVASGEGVWYIIPTPASPCPESAPIERCQYTFSDVFNNETLARDVFAPNTTVVVSRGDHVLNFEREMFYGLANLSDITFQGFGSTSGPLSRIMCASRFALAFINSSGITLNNLTFSNCGATINGFVDETFSIHVIRPEQKVALFVLNVQTFKMDSCLIEESYGYGILAVNALGQSTIYNSTFSRNNVYTGAVGRCAPRTLGTRIEDVIACNGGNALFVFEDLDQCPPEAIQYTLQILNSTFLDASNPIGGLLSDIYLTIGSGLGVILSQSSYGVTVTLDGVDSYRNGAMIAANLYIATYETVDNSTVLLRNSRILFGNGNQILSQLNGVSSAGLFVDYNLAIPPTTVPVCRNERKYQEDIVRITGCTFALNIGLLGSGAFFRIRKSAGKHVARFRVERSKLRNNIGASGSAIYVHQMKSALKLGTTEVLFEGVEVLSNTYSRPIRNLTARYSDFQLNTVLVVEADKVMFSNCNFTRNEGTALSVIQSEIFMSNLIIFDGNSGVVGGAINLKTSPLVFTPHTQLVFTENYALTHGGAINVIERSDVVSPCFLQVLDPTASYQQDPNVTLYFEGNYAEMAGSVLYGGSVDRCVTTARSSLDFLNATEAFNKLVDIGPHNIDTSLISSDSSAVCACVNNVPVCDVRKTKISLLPGVTKTFPFVTVGQRRGITPSTVYVISDMGTTLGQFQQAQQTGKSCTYLNFTVNTIASDTKLVIRTSNLDVSGSFVINVAVMPCPLGFILNQDGMCACDPIVDTCNLDTRTVFRGGGSWIGPYFSKPNESYEGVILFPNCPYDYCHRDGIDLDLTDPDSQCEFNRTGVLCGACKPGLSLPIGTNKCRECSDSTAASILVGAILAVGLVAILYILNLTVTAGTVGGLIFYANIVYGSSTIFFSTGSNSALLVIIRWLNLYSATEICFYNGYNEYARVWLGYAFPFMVWAIVILIILASRCSNTIARVCGSRSVPVLATLLLLSFNRLLREVIISLSFSVITYPDRSLSVVWTNDGNIGFWKGKHIALGIFAVIVLLLFIIPYTLLLVVVPLPCVQAYSTHRVLAWVNKLKPFMDAHHGPYKNNLRNWTGILLLVRILLSILNVVVIRGYDNDVILLVITIVMFLLLGFGWVARGGMYKSWPLNILECSFYLNLGILSAATLFVRQAGGNGQTAIIQTSGTIALLKLGGIVVYQAYIQISNLRKIRKWKESVLAKLKKTETPLSKANQTQTLSSREEDHSSSKNNNFDATREPLLDDFF